jgi:phthiocerol/phenolphthiocerol synthesis type-I polyketide synthase E
MIGNDKDFLCTRVSYKLDLRGPSMTIQTACSTSLVAVQAACRALQTGECDVALAGGVSISFPQRSGYVYQPGMILSPDGRCRPFDVDAAGTRGGAGAGIVVLKRLADALADRDTIHAVIRGAAVNNDGAAKAGYTAPSVDGQAEVISMAQSLAEVDPRSISYIEAHGTATPLGDPIEIAALTKVFRASTDDVGFCRLGSLKANLGHLDAAAGVAGLIKTVLALSNHEIPPLVNFREPNPQLKLEKSPFMASAEGSPWPSGATPRRAGVSSFGIGGTNAHVVLEEAPPVSPTVAAHDEVLLILSARTAAALEQATANLADCLAARDDLALPDVAWTLQVGRKSFGHRRAVVARDRAQAARLLRQPKQPSILTALHEGGERPVAFLFSGQGSQYLGMGADLYRSEPVYRQAIDCCAALLEPDLGLDLRDILYGDRGRDLLDQTRFTQPALFCTEYALASLWMHWGVRPKAMAGHSIGEYVAAHLAGVMSLEDALKVVAARGRLIQALPPGAMAAVHFSAAELRPRLPLGIEIAAVNGPSLCTISGPADELADALLSLEAGGIESRALHTSHAFHSAMMEPALKPFESLLRTIKLAAPTIPYVSNVSGTWIKAEQATSPAYYGAHLRQAVQFEAAVRTLAAERSLFLLEVGPGNVLATLVRGILGSEAAKHAASSLPNPRRTDTDTKTMLEAAGRLWVAGVPVAWSGMVVGDSPRRVPLPTYPFEHKRYVVEPAPAAESVRPANSAAPPDNAVRAYLPTWTRHGSLSYGVPRGHGMWLVLGDSGMMASAVVEGLRAAGAEAVLLEAGDSFHQYSPDRFRVRPGAADDFDSVVREVSASSGIVAGAILLRAKEATYAAWDFEGYSALIAVAAGLASWERDEPARVIVATVRSHSVIDEEVSKSAAAAVCGPVLVLPTELPGLQIRNVDLELQANAPDLAGAARALVREACSGGTESFVAFRREHRWVRRYEPVDLGSEDASDLPLKQGGAYLITGGLGGIGLKLASWLAVTVSARLLLTSRRPLPHRDDWDALLARTTAEEWPVPVIRSIREIEAAGGEVVTWAADATDASAMAEAIKTAVSRWGALDGVIHAAGIPGDGVIALRQTDQEIRSIIAPKVDGLAVLIDLLGDQPLEFVALMSSINSVVGSPGACAYAAANAVLDAFVDSAERPAGWRHVMAVNWGAWRDVGMAANLAVPAARRAEREAFLRASIAPEAGVAAFAKILASRLRRVVVTTFDLDDALARRQADGSDVGQASRAGATHTPAAGARERASDLPTRPELSSSFEPPGNDTERCLVAIWSELTGIADVGVHDDFFELGGHSLMATRVLARIGAVLRVRLALRDIFDAPTVRQLAERVAAAAGSGTEDDAASDEREEILI